MSSKQHRNPNRPTDVASAEYRRRHVLAIGAGMGVAMLAGCATETALNEPAGGGTPSGDADGSASAVGTFRLLISDQPVAIDDFEVLDVSLDRARIFRAGGTDAAEGTSDDDDDPEVESGPEDDDSDSDVNATEDGDNTVETGGNVTAVEPEDDEVENGTDSNETAVEVEAEVEGDDPENGDQAGFHVIDLDGATVDLKDVVGDKAIGVFEGDLEEGRYTKIELFADDVAGIVGGEPVDVTIPSGKLQLVKPFEVVAGETLSFVFDINVVKKGQSDEYNLLPVISESGVAGQDVQVEEVGNRHDDDDANDEDSEDEGEDSEPEDDQAAAGGDDGQGNGDGPPDEAEGDS